MTPGAGALREKNNVCQKSRQSCRKAYSEGYKAALEKLFGDLEVYLVPRDFIVLYSEVV